MCLEISLELLKAVWGQFSFKQFLVPACISSQGLQAPSNVVSANYRILICCTCHLQNGALFVYFVFLCLQVSSVSNFSPDTRGRGWSLIQANLSSYAMGGGATLQTNISGVCGECSQCLGHTGFAPAHGLCAFPVYTAQATGCSVGELPKASPGLRALPRSTPLRFRFSGTPQRHRLCWGCVLCPSQV